MATVLEPIRAKRPFGAADGFEDSLPGLMQSCHARLAELQRSLKKCHKTPGFFVYALRTALGLGNPQKDWGGFRDVGPHTACTPPSTTRALVDGVLRHLVGNVCPQAIMNLMRLPCFPKHRALVRTEW